mmetsp:Transcript_8900/g.19002  ORF Transcript_8900/g.19002 Transcript_8900/m.19002 type:complete len:505 (-) Transcript_8900:682-2196(-)
MRPLRFRWRLCSLTVFLRRLVTARLLAFVLRALLAALDRNVAWPGAGNPRQAPVATIAFDHVLQQLRDVIEGDVVHRVDVSERGEHRAQEGTTPRHWTPPVPLRLELSESVCVLLHPLLDLLRGHPELTQALDEVAEVKNVTFRFAQQREDLGGPRVHASLTFCHTLQNLAALTLQSRVLRAHSYRKKVLVQSLQRDGEVHHADHGKGSRLELGVGVWSGHEELEVLVNTHRLVHEKESFFLLSSTKQNDIKKSRDLTSHILHNQWTALLQTQHQLFPSLPRVGLGNLRPALEHLLYPPQCLEMWVDTKRPLRRQPGNHRGVRCELIGREPHELPLPQLNRLSHGGLKRPLGAVLQFVSLTDLQPPCDELTTVGLAVGPAVQDARGGQHRVAKDHLGLPVDMRQLPPPAVLLILESSNQVCSPFQALFGLLLLLLQALPLFHRVLVQHVQHINLGQHLIQLVLLELQLVVGLGTRSLGGLQPGFLGFDLPSHVRIGVQGPAPEA